MIIKSLFISRYVKMCIQLSYHRVPEYRNNDSFSLYICFLLVDKIADRMLRMHKLEHIRAGGNGLMLLWNFQLEVFFSVIIHTYSCINTCAMK